LVKGFKNYRCKVINICKRKRIVENLSLRGEYEAIGDL
jgi:hypothetical protein